MLGYYKKPVPNWQAWWYRLSLLFALLSVAYIMPGCSSDPSKQSFEGFGSSGGLSLEKPGNWHAKFDDRNETIVLTAKSGILRKDSARIVIQPFTTLAKSSSLSEHLGAAIDLLGTRHNLDSVSVIQEPTLIEGEKHKVATATILLPTLSIPEDSTANQVGVKEPDTFQIVELHAIRCTNNFAMVYIYKGNSEQLNAEAKVIVDSVELTCSTEP